MMIRVGKMKSRQKGFTLIELLIAMLISGMVMAAIYTVFNSQRKSYYVQDQVAEMQQNLRSALDMVSRDVRMTGFDPSGDATCAIIETATNGRFKFFMDSDEDGFSMMVRDESQGPFPCCGYIDTNEFHGSIRSNFISGFWVI